MTEFTHSFQHKARKKHICDFCGDAILPGNEYIKITSRTDNGFSRYFYHIHCDAIINDYITNAEDGDFYDTWDILEKYEKKGCMGCALRDDECGIAPITCPEAAKRALHPTVLPAVLESIERQRKDAAV